MHQTGIGTEGLMDGRMEAWTVRLLHVYASQKSFGGIRNSSVKKRVELMIAANPVCIYSTSLYKAWVGVLVILASK